MLPGGLALHGQTKPEFEAATIKSTAVDPDTVPKLRSDPGRLTYTNVTLRDCIKIAWRLEDNQLEAPKVVDAFRFDLAAAAAGATSEESMRLMLRNLLIDRFALAVHEESRELPVYELKVAGKPQLHRSDSEGPYAKTFEGGRMVFSHATMERLAADLSESTGRHVIDKTGLGGSWDFSLDILSDPADATRIMRGKEVNDLTIASLQSRLGLRLESHRSPVIVLIVDHAEKLPRDH